MQRYVQFCIKFLELQVKTLTQIANANGEFPAARAILILVIGALTAVVTNIGLRMIDGSSFAEAATSGAPWVWAGGWVVGAGLFVVLGITMTRMTHR